MSPTTPDEWLPILLKQIDDRSASLKRMRSYCDGNAPLPEMGRNVKASWEAFQKKARTNYGGLAVRALKNRIRPLGATVGDGTNSELTARVERIWRDNRLSTQINMAIRDRLEVSVGYLVVGAHGEFGSRQADITREKPELFTAVADPLRPWRAKAAIKLWRDKVAGYDYAYVWAGGERQQYVRASKSSDGVLWTRAAPKPGVGGDWARSGDPEPYEGDPPVVILERPDGRALLEEHYDVIDAMNLGKLQRLVILAMQAFRQRGIKGDLPRTDEDGNAIDWAKVFEPAPGALWDLPEGIDVWESQVTDVQGILEAEKADRRDFAAVTSTPVSVFIPDGANQSAQGAANAEKGHVALAQDEIDDLKPGLATAIVYALRAEGVDLQDQTVEVAFVPPALVSLAEQFDAASKAKALGLTPRTIMRMILGWSPDQIRAAEADMAAQALADLFTVDETPDAAAD